MKQNLRVNKTNFHIKGFALLGTRFETEAKGNSEVAYCERASETSWFSFSQGELRGVRGLVPSNFLEDLVETPDAPSMDTSKLNSTYVSGHV